MKIKTFRAFLALFSLLVALHSNQIQAAQKGIDKTIGLYLAITLKDTAQNEAFEKAFRKEFAAMYGKEVKTIRPASGQTLNKSADSLIFVGAGYGVDHLIGFEGEGDVKFLKQKKRDAEFVVSFNGSAWISDVAGTKPLITQPIQISTQGKLEDYAPEMFTKGALDVLSQKMFGSIGAQYNPNIMKRLNLKDVADYFYEKRDCARALPLYERAESKESQFDILDEISKKKMECASKVSTQAREVAGFKLDLKFRRLSEDMQGYFKKAVEVGRFEERFKSHLSKPLTIEIEMKGSAENPGEGELIFSVIHDPKRYAVAKNLDLKSNQNYLDFRVYQSLLAEFLYFKSVALQQMPAPQKKIFSNYAVRFQLEKANGDYLTFFVYPDTSGKVTMPSKMLVKVAGYKAVELEQMGVQTANTFGLGPAKNIDGGETIYYIVYRFFEP